MKACISECKKKYKIAATIVFTERKSAKKNIKLGFKTRVHLLCLKINRYTRCPPLVWTYSRLVQAPGSVVVQILKNIP